MMAYLSLIRGIELKSVLQPHVADSLNKTIKPDPIHAVYL